SSPSHCEATVTHTRRDGGQHCDEAFTPGFHQVTAARPVVSYLLPLRTGRQISHKASSSQ
ncbi:MAG: hypothetical protein M3451_05205, partial [Chloroflexota bacterium]|nr:hypothetical protein [Chloroflexota bacterium]